ncbi:unnamed protein product [Cyclocybe aegerita]|uniref:non-specific serine/threonine protein kinase n=1 Tax=Cyclocybe aegerita TaxID=1973307 RepID=A0A8S0XJI3_CYCAE|nr:unnamed protein product [Cyclocybe aegerita]
MNNTPPSTPFPVPGFAGADNNASPAEFLKFLRSLTTQYLGDNSPRILAANKAAWVTIVNGLTDHFLGSFPLPDIVSWSAMQERVEVAEVTLEAIKRVFERVEGIYNDSEELVRKLFARLLDLCRVLDVWTEPEVVCEEAMFSPAHMKEKVSLLLIAVLRGLGDNAPAPSEQHSASWKVLREVLVESLGVCNDLITPLTPLTNVAVVALFGKPRILVAKDDPELEVEGNALNITIFPLSRIASFLVVVLEVVVQVIVLPLKCQWFLADIRRAVIELTRSLFTHLTDSSCPTTSTLRTASILRTLSVTAPLRQIPECRAALGCLPECLLQLRLGSALKLDWDVADRSLAAIFAKEQNLPVSRAVIQAICFKMANYHWDAPDKEFLGLLWAFLRSALPQLETTLLTTLRETMESVIPSPERISFLEELSKYPQEHETSNKSKANEGRLIIQPHVWRQRVQDSVQDIIYPDVLSWMDDDEGSSVPDLCQRSLYEIQVRFEQRPLQSTTAIARSGLLERISALPCLLAQCDQSNCLEQNGNNQYIMAQVYVPLVSRLLKGTDDEVTVEIRRKTYSALSHIFKHHSGTQDLTLLWGLLHRGLIDPDRNVRLSAGSALSSLVQLYGTHGKEGYDVTEPIFAQLYQQFETSKNPVRETLLPAVGAMGKTNNAGILGQVLCLLIAQLGRQNPVIKGMACMHILAIAKYHNKTPYSLVLPYLDQAAPFIIQRLPMQPVLLTEACRLMSIAPADFIMITLPHTLPEVFATGDQKVLDAITKELSTRAPALLLKHSHTILAHIFMLRSQSATTKALNFVVKVVNDASRSKIDIQSIVKSCVVPLLAELVMVMGDDNQDVARQGVAALKKVEGVLTSSNNLSPTPDLGGFLKNYMLGLISDINDILQDVQGKKPLALKQKILRSLGALVELIGPAINNVAPQIMATFQTMVTIPELSEVTLESWYKFLTTLAPTELGSHVGPTSAAFVMSWPAFSTHCRDIAVQTLEYILCTMGETLNLYLNDVVDLSVIDELHPLADQLKVLRGKSSPKEEVLRILKQSSSDNLAVAMQALRELKNFMMKDHKDFIRQITSGDAFDPLVGHVLNALFSAACRDNGDGTESLRLLAFECIGVLGALDPDRCEINYRNTNMVVLKNFTDDVESILFALHLIQDLLVSAFRSTSDIKYQSHLAYSIQELLKFCQFTPALVATVGAGSISVKIRNRWNNLPKHVLETVTPLLEGRFTLNQSTTVAIQHPVYPTQSTYREWIQLWTTHLISRVSGKTAQRIFGVFRSAVRSKDVVVAHHLLPHLILNILISGDDDDAQAIRTEMLTVLEDQVDIESNSTSDKKLLSAQAVFMLLDHLNKWIRVVRQDINSKKNESKRARPERISFQIEDQLLRLDSILSSIDQTLMAKAAFQCKAYARSLMSFEQQILTLQERKANPKDLQEYYEKLHEIYSYLDEPDGMEGISTLILSPSLEHQIREHESTGRWTSSQSCWEVRLQESPDNVEFHLGLLRCLRNLGHYDTLRTHVTGVLTRHPEWEGVLSGFQVESAWMVGAWDDVQRLAGRVDAPTSSMVIARVLLAMRTEDANNITEALAQARIVMGAPITASGVKGYRRSYEAVLDLHMTHELEVIYNIASSLPPGSQNVIKQERQRAILALSKNLAGRLDFTLPTFRIREPILSMRRTAFALVKNPRLGLGREIGKAWLASSKIARKAKQWQTAYSATLQAQQAKMPWSFIESAKLLKETDHLRALNDLESSTKMLGLFDDVVDLTTDADWERMKAKIQVIRARWMHETDRFEMSEIFSMLQDAAGWQKEWESGHYHLGHFHDECFKGLSLADQKTRGLKMNFWTVRSFSRAIMHGSKYVYQTVPRLLTIWLDMGENKIACQDDNFKKMTDNVSRCFQEAPVFKWYTAFPQIVSRVGHENPEVYRILAKLIVLVLETYPKQALWLFTAVVKSTKSNRKNRGKTILNQLRSNPHKSRERLSKLIGESLAMTDELLALCDSHVDDNKNTLSMAKDFPKLSSLGRSDLIIPLQESLIATLPPASTEDSKHQPFPVDAPTFNEFADEIEVMRSLAKPRKISVRGSNGQVYTFLGKPKDDLRKDARLMDLNAIINKLLKRDSESRRRQLHIRTYGVVTLNEECGFIQWVPNTAPIRPILLKLYDARRIKSWSGEMAQVFARVKDTNNPINEKACADLFESKILSVFKPVFHEWFIETFPEPTAWLASRLAYGRTAAVMSMVGFILGLGDRHCENILLDTNSGDVVHVDFNCLFEKGKLLETPERVPFRLTQNIIDGFGVSGVEGVFRIACESTLQLLRDNKDSLMSVLDAFVHDPLVEWEDEKRKLDREPTTRAKNATNKSKDKDKDRDKDKDPAAAVQTAAAKPKIDMRDLARAALNPIEKKLKGIYSPNNASDKQERERSTSNLVQMLIQEATDKANLSRMYPGWAPWH